jgi:transposase
VQRIAALRATHPETADWQLWAMDEHRIGLEARAAAPVGTARSAPQPARPPRYQWAYLYGFVEPESGRAFLSVRARVNAAEFSAALADFAARADLGVNRRAALLLDGAGWHRAKALVWPEGVHPVPLPPYGPELQPAEPLWTLTNEAVANRTFADLEELKAVQAARCAALEAEPERIRRLTCFHWWPKLNTQQT